MASVVVEDAPQNGGSLPPNIANAASSGLSTISQLSQFSSGFYSMESCSDDDRCDSLSRAFQELGMQEAGISWQATAATTAAHVDGWVQRSCEQLVSEVETDDEAFQDDVTEVGDAEELEAEEDEEAWASRTAIKRCSSLRSNCSTDSDGGQRTKKAVRFADSLGLDLIKVRHVFNLESPPETEPTLRRLGRRRDSLAPASKNQLKRRLLVSPCFPQPGGCIGFISRVMSQKVVLERAVFEQSTSVLSGHIRVCNLHYDKRVTVRVTFDGWHSCTEVLAVYEVSKRAADMTDRFTFRVPMPHNFGTAAGDRAALCVRYETLGQTFWDSNYGENYAFDCLPLGWEDSDDESLAKFS